MTSSPRALLPPQCRQLLGPHYALLGPEYAQLHPLVPKRTELRRVLVFFGGVDPDNLTSRTLEAMMEPELEHLAVDVVLGPQSPHRKVVAALVARRPLTTLHNPLPSLAGLIARADLAIGAGRATTWERACLGLASIVIPIAANQLQSVDILQRYGMVMVISAETLAQSLVSALQDLSQNPFKLLLPDIEALKLPDGCGAKLVSHHVINQHG